jgi:hypothetical protein
MTFLIFLFKFLLSLQAVKFQIIIV